MNSNSVIIPQNISQTYLDFHPQSFKITKPITIGEIKNCLIKNEFQLLRLLFHSHKFKSEKEQNRNFKELNRYKDVQPYRYNIVTTNGESLSFENYINANFIINPFKCNSKGRFIATQGPLTKTSEHFWKMALTHKTKRIVAIVEKDMVGKSCADYWSHKNKQYGSIQIQSLSLQKNNSYAVRRILVTDLSTGEQSIISHYHLYFWRDKTAPSDSQKDFFIRFLSGMAMVAMEDEDESTIVHCSAGIGRTCTFLCAYFLYELFIDHKQQEKEFQFSVFEIVRLVREQRFGAVNKLTQYQFLYEIVQNFK